MSKPLVIIQAEKLGWRPELPNRSPLPQKMLHCTAGCGRAVVHFEHDPTVSYTCLMCQSQAATFMAAKKKKGGKP